MDLSTPKLRTTVTEAAALINECAADLSETIRNTPISLDLLRIRAVVDQRGPRHTVAEINELERTYHTLRRALEPYRQSAFSVQDLRCAVDDTGYGLDDYCGDPAVFFTPGRGLESDKNEFIVELALVAPRQAHVIMRAAQWSPGANCLWWDLKEIERKAA